MKDHLTYLERNQNSVLLVFTLGNDNKKYYTCPRCIRYIYDINKVPYFNITDPINQQTIFSEINSEGIEKAYFIADFDQHFFMHNEVDAIKAVIQYIQLQTNSLSAQCFTNTPTVTTKTITTTGNLPITDSKGIINTLYFDSSNDMLVRRVAKLKKYSFVGAADKVVNIFLDDEKPISLKRPNLLQL